MFPPFKRRLVGSLTSVSLVTVNVPSEETFPAASVKETVTSREPSSKLLKSIEGMLKLPLVTATVSVTFGLLESEKV